MILANALHYLSSPGFNMGCHHLPICASVLDGSYAPPLCDCGLLVRQELMADIAGAVYEAVEQTTAITGAA